MRLCFVICKMGCFVVYAGKCPLPSWCEDFFGRQNYLCWWDVSKLRHFAGSIGTVSNISKYREELEQLIKSEAKTHALVSQDATCEEATVFALLKQLEVFLVAHWSSTPCGRTHGLCAWRVRFSAVSNGYGSNRSDCLHKWYVGVAGCRNERRYVGGCLVA